MREDSPEYDVQAVLTGIANRARVSKTHRFGGLYSLLKEPYLRWSFQQLNRRAAPGVDGESWREYASELDQRLPQLAERLKRKAYRARQIRRSYIPKSGGRKRPLGIPVVEDKAVQYGGAKILEAIYEADFIEYSFAYRPGRGAKDAVYELNKQIQFGRFRWAVEADIRGFFDNLGHAWTVRMLEHRIKDRAFVGLIHKWLKAGVMEDMQTVIHPGAGTPQGGVISPMLANIYLHYALDLWFEKVVKRRCRGRALLIRYADDFVCLFQYKEDAEQFYADLPQRLGKFGLEVATEKTRLLKFTRFDTGPKNESFEFLGFEFRWGLNRQYKPQVKRRTSRARMRKAVAEMTAWLRGKARGLSIRQMMQRLHSKLLGHWNYYGVHGNSDSLWEYWALVGRLLHKWLNRRSQRRSYSWEQLKRLLQRHAVAKPRIIERGRLRLGFA